MNELSPSRNIRIINLNKYFVQITYRIKLYIYIHFDAFSFISRSAMAIAVTRLIFVCIETIFYALVFVLTCVFVPECNLFEMYLRQYVIYEMTAI